MKEGRKKPDPTLEGYRKVGTFRTELVVLFGANCNSLPLGTLGSMAYLP